MASHPELGEYTLSCGGSPELPFTENEYFHGDAGAGIGASHQTGWTGLVARSMDLFGRVTAEDALRTPKDTLDARLVPDAELDRLAADGFDLWLLRRHPGMPAIRCPPSSWASRSRWEDERTGEPMCSRAQKSTPSATIPKGASPSRLKA